MTTLNDLRLIFESKKPAEEKVKAGLLLINDMYAKQPSYVLKDSCMGLKRYLTQKQYDAQTQTIKSCYNLISTIYGVNHETDRNT